MEFFLKDISSSRPEPWGYREKSPSSKDSNVMGWIDHLSKGTSPECSDPDTRDDLTQVCRMVINESRDWQVRRKSTANQGSWMSLARGLKPPYSSEVVARAIVISLGVDDGLFEEAIEVSSDEALALTSSSYEIAESLLRRNQEALFDK
jgi:hypothetical protein